MKNLIIGVEKNSIAEELGIEAGDFCVSIDEKEILDIFDYRYLIKNEFLELLIEKKDGDEIIFEIEKDEDEDLGIIFEDGIMDDAKSCKNKCIFCFIDQLPKNMRPTLYFKDDDSRLSFLQGNYITLTNMSEKDIERIIFYHLSPINISVHTTDSELRKFMLKNPKSDNLLPFIEKLYNANIEMNFQIVLCKSVNDKENLDKTILDLSKYIGKAKSLSVVPVGITKFREGLFSLDSFNKEDSEALLQQLDKHSEVFRKKYGTNFVYASDEFYLKAGREIPNADFYEDFYQIENGVGMISSFRQEFFDYLENFQPKEIKKSVTIVTGVLAYDFIKSLADELCNKFSKLDINIVKVKNEFFGEKITVSGLLTGEDIINSLLNSKIGDIILIPENALRDGEDVFLDDIRIFEIEKRFGVKTVSCENNGKCFIENICGK